MKTVGAQLAFFLSDRSARRNVRALLKLIAALTGIILLYSVVFHIIMLTEGQDHSYVTGFYWTLTVMSTLGFGDITFTGDLGRMFSVLVLVTGVMFLLVLLPFSFIQFFWVPWVEAQRSLRTPRSLPDHTAGHVILTAYEPVSMALIERLDSYGREYVVLENDPARASTLFDQGVSVVIGDRDDQATYRNLRADKAALVLVAGDDFGNTATTFTVRQISATVPIVSLARAPESIDILQLAGATQVVQLADMLGRSLARRTLGGETRANVIGRFDQLLIAEAPVSGTPLIGRTLADLKLRESTGVTVVGAWERGDFTIPGPDFSVSPSTVLVLAGSEAQLQQFDQLVAIYNLSDAPALIIGAGRVGRAAARYLLERDIPYCLIDPNPARLVNEPRSVVGSAADIEVLERAGIREAPTTIVTTREDETNIYLTIYCRSLRPAMQLISRATLERNISTLHRAGADIVMSYASMGANAAFNVLEQNDVVMLAEGLDVFRHPTPATLVGRTLAASRIREDTGCSVIAIEGGGKTVLNPNPLEPIPAGTELILIGTTAGERTFVNRYPS